MKKILIYAALTLAALLSVSCARERYAPEAAAIEDVLTFFCTDPVTKAGISGTASDDPSWNEDLINTLDVYFYPAGGTESDAVVHKTFDPGAHTTYSTSINFTTGEISSIFTDTYCTVYAIANIDRSLLPSGLTGTSITNLKNILLPENKFGSVAGTSHVPASFIMDGQNRINLINRNKTIVATGEVPLYRLAAKVSLMIHVPDEIQIPTTYKEDDSHIYDAIEFWQPMSGLGTSGVPQVEAYLEYGNARARLGVRSEPGTYLPNSYTAPATDYVPFSYKKNRMKYQSGQTVTVEEQERYTWQWYQENKTGNNETDAALRAQVGQVTGNTTNTVYMIADPAYTYPMTWQDGSDTEPYLKLVLPWKRIQKLMVYKEGDWVEMVGSTAQKQYYYKIIFPNDEILSNNWYQYKINIGILGSENDDAKVNINCTYMVADWQNYSEVLEEAEVGNARYISVAQDAYTLYNVQTLKIPYITSDECEIVNATYEQPYYGTNTSGKTQRDGVWYSTGTAASVNATITCSEGVINFSHDIVNTVSNNMDVAPYTFTFTIRHISDHQYHRDVTVYQYPAIYMEKVPGGSAFVDGYFAQVYNATMPGARKINNYYARSDGQTGANTNQNATYNVPFTSYYTSSIWTANGTNATVTTTYDGNVTTPYLNLLRAQVPQYFTLLDITKLTVTAFTSSSNKFTDHTGRNIEYIIGDPREPSNWTSGDLADYLSSIPANGNSVRNTTTSWGNKAGQIMLGTTNTAFIAPAMYFSSAWSAKTGNVSFETATKRCATYQEAGYPAGRWRLPTEAEVNFVRSLQAQSKIPVLFNNDAAYWTSSGYTYNGTTYNNPNGAVDSGVRCVYDVWYWGETAMDISTFHPEPQ